MHFEHLKHSATESFQNATALQLIKPEASLACKSSGHYALASFLLANDEPTWESEVRASIEVDLARFRGFGTTVRSFPQPRHIVLALAIGDKSLAKAIAEIPLDRKNWSVLDAHFTYHVCKALNVSQESKEPKGKLTGTELALVRAVEAVCQDEEPDMAAVDRAWSLLRKKRYQFTIFEHGNLIRIAIENLINAGRAKNVA